MNPPQPPIIEIKYDYQLSKKETSQLGGSLY